MGLRKLFLVFTAMAAIVFAQVTREATWEREIDAGYSRQVGENLKILPDSAGNLYLFSEIIRYGENRNVVVRKYNSQREEVWEYEYNGAANPNDTFYAAKIISADSIAFIVNSGDIFHYVILSSEGEIAHDVTLDVPVYNSALNNFEFDDKNNVYALSKTDYDFYVYRFNRLGKAVSTGIHVDGYGWACSLDLNRGYEPVVYVYYTWGPADLKIYQFNYDLALRWSVSYPGGYLNAAFDSKNNLYAIRKDDVIKVSKIDTSGRELWTYTTTGNSSYPKIGVNEYDEIFVFEDSIFVFNSDGGLLRSSRIPEWQYGRKPVPFIDGSMIFNSLLISRDLLEITEYDSWLAALENSCVEMKSDECREYDAQGHLLYTFTQTLPDIPVLRIFRPVFDSYGNCYMITTNNELLKTDADGNILWKTELEDDLNRVDNIYHQTLNSDRNVIVYNEREGNTIKILLYDSRGAVIRKNEFSMPDSGREYLRFKMLRKGKKRLFVAIATTYEEDYIIYLFPGLLILDFEGNVINYEEIESHRYREFDFMTMAVDGDDNCSLVGFTFENREKIFPVMYWENRTNSADVFLSDLGKEELNNLTLIFDDDGQGNFYTCLTDPTSGQSESFLAKYDGKGRLIFKKKMGDSTSEYFISKIRVFPNNSVLFSRYYYRTNSSEIYILSSSGELINTPYLTDYPEMEFGYNYKPYFIDNYKVMIYNYREKPFKVSVFNLLNGELLYTKIQDDYQGRYFNALAVTGLYPGTFFFVGNRWLTSTIATIMRFDFEEIKEYAENNYPDFYLAGNYPNPFNGQTTIKYYISQPGKVEIEIYNVLGQKIENWKGTVTGGHHYHKVKNISLGSGVYFYRITYAGRSITDKMIYVK